MNSNILSKQDDDSKELFSLIHIPWKQSKSEVWTTVSKKMKSTPIIEMKPKVISWQFVAAAVVILFISIGTFVSTFTITNTTLNAQNINTKLPDGSRIMLNPGSEISYKPYWWWTNRKVNLKGEAFFEVEKGKTFSVESNYGIVEVLGTSFNIFSRNDNYEVTCVTGKVKVEAKTTHQSVIIYAKEKAVLEKTGQFKVEGNINVENSKAWMNDKMIFTSQPLNEVFNEIERQYDVEIILHDEIIFEYSGSLDKNDKLEDILHLICRPFELKVNKKNNQYHIEK